MAGSEHQGLFDSGSSRRMALKLAGAAAAGGTAAVLASTLPGSPIGSGSVLAAFTVASRFSFEIDGVLVAGVHTIEDLDTESAVVDQGNGKSSPGGTLPGRCTASKDWSNTSEWFRWRKTVIDGKVDRKSISIIFHNDAGEEAGRINLFNCWPVKWSMNARQSAHAVERLEVVFERMELK